MATFTESASADGRTNVPVLDGLRSANECYVLQFDDSADIDDPPDIPGIAGSSGFNIKAIYSTFRHDIQNGTLWVFVEVGSNNPFDADGNGDHTTVDPAAVGISDLGPESYRVIISSVGDETIDRVDFELTATGVILPKEPKDPSRLKINSAGVLRSGNFQQSLGPRTGSNGTPQGGLEFKVSYLSGVTNAMEADEFRICVIPTFQGGTADEEEAASDHSVSVPNLYVVASVTPGSDLNGDGRINQADAEASDVGDPEQGIALPDFVFTDDIGAVPGAALFVRLRLENTGPDPIENIDVSAPLIEERFGDPDIALFGPEPRRLFPAESRVATYSFVFNPSIGVGTLECRDFTETVTAQGEQVLPDGVRPATGSTDTVSVFCLKSTLKTLVTVDDDDRFDEVADSTPRSDAFVITGRYPVTLQVHVEVFNDPALNGPTDLTQIQLLSPLLEGRGTFPPAPFGLEQFEPQRFTVPVTIRSEEDCRQLDLLDGVQDGLIRIDVTSAGRFIVNAEGLPAVLDSRGDPKPFPEPQPSGSGSATIQCNLSPPPVPSLSSIGLLVLAIALAFVMFRVARLSFFN